MTTDPFELSDNIAVLTFAGGRFDGVEVRVSLDAAVEDVFDFDEAPTTKEEILAAYTRFGDAYLRSWNVTRQGVPLPADGAGLCQAPPTLVGQIINQWKSVIFGLDPPSPPPSSNGPTSGPLPASEELSVESLLSSSAPRSSRASAGPE